MIDSYLSRPERAYSRAYLNGVWQNLSTMERSLLLGTEKGWRSWMRSAGMTLVHKGLGTRNDTGIDFDTPLALALIDAFSEQPGVYTSIENVGEPEERYADKGFVEDVCLPRDQIKTSHDVIREMQTGGTLFERVAVTARRPSHGLKPDPEFTEHYFTADAAFLGPPTYVTKVEESSITLHPTPEDAAAGTNPIDLSLPTGGCTFENDPGARSFGEMYREVSERHNAQLTRDEIDVPMTRAMIELILPLLHAAAALGSFDAIAIRLERALGELDGHEL